MQTQHPARGIPSAALALLSVVLAMLAGPSVALASWPVGGDPEVVTAFEEPYVSVSGASAVHRGVDCAAEAGEPVTSPVEGTVSFTGSVPAGEEAGCGTTLAVSVDLVDGRTLTLMPFDEVLVEVGDRVDEGSVVGYLAASGDKSSARTHLHVGLKRNGVYYDPLPLLGMEAPGGEGQPKPGVDPVLAPVPDGRGCSPVAEGAFAGVAATEVAWEEEPSATWMPAQPAADQASSLEAAAGGAASSNAGEAAARQNEDSDDAHGSSVQTISSSEGAYEGWLAKRNAALSEEEGLSNPLAQAQAFLCDLPGRVAALIGDMQAVLGSAAPVVATALFSAIAAAFTAGVARLLRALSSRRGRTDPAERPERVRLVRGRATKVGRSSPGRAI